MPFIFLYFYLMIWCRCDRVKSCLDPKSDCRGLSEEGPGQSVTEKTSKV